MNEWEILDRHVKSTGLKMTAQRRMILEEFLSIEEHVSAERLFEILRKKDPSIGQATVFRTLKLFAEAGIAEPVLLTEKVVFYEHRCGHTHHDHLVCLECGSVTEFFDETIETLQEAVCERLGFAIRSHRLELFGICPECKTKNGDKGAKEC